MTDAGDLLGVLITILVMFRIWYEYEKEKSA